MTFDIQTLGLERMTASEKYDLVAIILGSMPEQVDKSEISPEQMAEILRRRREADQNPGVGRHWREVIADLRKQL